MGANSGTLLLMFFAGLACCFSPSSEVDSSIKNVARFGKHVMESYSGGYESVDDLKFKEFMSGEVLRRGCEHNGLHHNGVRSSVLKRSLIGQGSHRQLASSIRLELEVEPSTQLPAHACNAILIERLPSGVFADPFELQHLLHRKVYTDVGVFGDTNLELPSIVSKQTVVEVHMDLGPDFLGGHVKELELSIEIPLHIRYPPLDESGYHEVRFGAPDLLIHCDIEDTVNKTCICLPSTNATWSRTSSVVWRIPSGVMGHTGAVSAITVLSAFASALLIVVTSVLNSNFKTVS